MEEEYRIKMGQHAVDAEQHIAHDRKDTQRHDGAHAKAAEHRKSRGVPHDIDPPHGEGSFADPDPNPDQCAGRRSASAAEKPVSMPRFALSGSCRGAAVTISPRISRTAPYTAARRHFHLRMVRWSSGVSLNGKDLGFIRA